MKRENSLSKVCSIDSPFQLPFDWPLLLYTDTDSKEKRMLTTATAPSTKYTRVFLLCVEIPAEKETNVLQCYYFLSMQVKFSL